MRKMIVTAVAAGLILPMAAPSAALAQSGPGTRREGDQAAWNARLASREAYAREQQREDRQDRREDRREARQDRREDRREDRRDWREDRREVRQDRREWRDDHRDGRGDWREDRRDARRDYRADRREARRDYRDWRAYRQADARAFRRGAYVAPRGYAYRPVRAGARLRANAFWGQRYWLDPYDYYLPQPRYGYQRWIRYGDDVLLLDTRTGAVLVVYDRFFW